MTHIKGHRKIHLIGIGGCSMSGLAQILLSRGYAVQGSDVNPSPFTERLMELGIPVFIGHDPKNIGDADLIIYSAAIRPDNPERLYGKAHHILELERSVALGQLTEGYARVVGIAGCHGKTTITSMLALISLKSALDATIHVGGFTEFLNGGVSIGSNELFITEACEYVESFLTLHPTIAVINNVDDDHLDYYRDIEHITEAFRKYLSRLPENGLFICCKDDPRVRGLLDTFKGRAISYGMTDADYTPSGIEYDALGNPSFDLMHHGKKLGRIRLTVPGEHMVTDAMAAAVTAMELGARMEDIASALHEFKNARRRFEFYGERGGIKVFHDYAHHPAEIKKVLDAAARYPHKKLWCVFQCNSYTRAKTLFTKDVNCFSSADGVLVPDIYPGREIDDGSVHARDMVRAIEQSGTRAVYIPAFEGIRAYLDRHAQSGDMVMTVGSGDVYKKTRLLL